MRALLVTLILTCLLGPLAATAAARELTGRTPAGAFYRIAVPDGWRAGDTLVLYQHGFNFDAATGPPGLGPLRDLMLSEGYAVAASSFRQGGWALFHAIDDNRDLLDVFAAQVAKPGQIIPFGGSMGGLVALKLAEQELLPPVPGVLSLCPAAAGSRLWDSAIDLRLAYDVVCDGTGSLPQGSPPLPWAVNLGDIPRDLGDLQDQGALLDVLIPLNRCTGINVPAQFRNGAMKRRLAQLMALAGITDESFFITNVGYAIYAMADLARAADKLAAHNPFTTAGVDYGDAQINAEIVRLQADPMAALKLQALSDVRGRVGAAKVISLQTSQDQLVIPGNQDALRQRLPASQLTSAIVAEDAPSHCGFTTGEGVAAWESLRAWIAGAPKPEVADLQRSCAALVASGQVDGPCRFDADAQYTPFDEVVRPRPASAQPPVDRRYTGQWYAPDRSGEGFYIEILDAQRALVTFYTYPASGVAGDQAWLYSVGTIKDNTIALDLITRPMRNASGEFFHQTWGRAWLVFDDCSSARVRWEGAPGWGSYEENLSKLTAIDGLGCNAAPDAHASGALSGSWSVLGTPGYGISLERISADRLAVSWNQQLDGRQGWYGGVLERAADGHYRGGLYSTAGTGFGAGFDPAAVVRTIEGSLDLSLDCPRLAGVLSLTGSAPWQFALERLTVPVGVDPACAL